jgi:hypothetical protein
MSLDKLGIVFPSIQPLVAIYTFSRARTKQSFVKALANPFHYVAALLDTLDAQKIYTSGSVGSNHV